MWRYAANLTACTLRGAERAEALQRWARHVRGAEGSLWGAAGILVSAGCLQEALQVGGLLLLLLLLCGMEGGVGACGGQPVGGSWQVLISGC